MRDYFLQSRKTFVAFQFHFDEIVREAYYPVSEKDEHRHQPYAVTENSRYRRDYAGSGYEYEPAESGRALLGIMLFDVAQNALTRFESRSERDHCGSGEHAQQKRTDYYGGNDDFIAHKLYLLNISSTSARSEYGRLTPPSSI